MRAHPWILIAEDDEHIARLIQFKLRKSGYEVELARNGQEAVGRLGDRAWSLLVLDVMMPILDGWAVLRRARETAELARTPVLMLTAKNIGKDPLAELADQDMTRVLRKPFDPAELARIVASMTETARSKEGAS